MKKLILNTENLRILILKSANTISDREIKNQVEEWLEKYYITLKTYFNDKREKEIIEYFRSTSTNNRLIRKQWLTKLNFILKRIKKDKYKNSTLQDNSSDITKILHDKLLKKIKKVDNKIYILCSELNQNWIYGKCFNSCGILMRIIFEKSLDIKNASVKSKFGLKNKINLCQSTNVFGKSISEALKKLDNSTKITGDIVAHDSNIILIKNDIELAIIPFRILLSDIF